LPSRAASLAAFSRTEGATRKAICGEAARAPDSEGLPAPGRTCSTIVSASDWVRRVPPGSLMSSRSRSTSGPNGVCSVMGGGLRRGIGVTSS
jgi:hypothetical protein